MKSQIYKKISPSIHEVGNKIIRVIDIDSQLCINVIETSNTTEDVCRATKGAHLMDIILHT